MDLFDPGETHIITLYEKRRMSSAELLLKVLECFDLDLVPRIYEERTDTRRTRAVLASFQYAKCSRQDWLDD
jgi:hypothetical protein